jgi:hypothetical protein
MHVFKFGIRGQILVPKFEYLDKFWSNSPVSNIMKISLPVLELYAKRRTADRVGKANKDISTFRYERTKKQVSR